jgi:hypothetical protein
MCNKNTAKRDTQQQRTALSNNTTERNNYEAG